jgi:HlyD family secretion protein
MESQINNWQSENYQLNMQLIELNSQKKQLISDKEKYTIIAAIDGVIVNYSGTLEGNIISPNQKIAEITPVRDLIAECYVSPADIGLIHDSMFVKFQIDAFNYNQWGLATGKVIDISEDLVAIQDNSVFIVKCTIDQKYLELKNKYKGNLSKGLTLTSRFQVTRRSLFQLLFDKVDNWLNPKLIKK